MGNPEDWQSLPKGKQIRKAKPARLCITVFGKEKGSEERPSSQMKSLAEGDRSASLESEKASPCPLEETAEDVPMGETALEKSEGIREPDIDMGIVGHPPKNIPRHGPRFLGLGKEERDWIRQVHHRMGHPDPQKFAQFLKSTHAAEACCGRDSCWLSRFPM